MNFAAAARRCSILPRAACRCRAIARVMLHFLIAPFWLNNALAKNNPRQKRGRKRTALRK